MDEFLIFLKVDYNWIWALASVISGVLFISTLLPSVVRRHTIVVAQVAKWVSHDQAVILDIRNKNEYVQGHIPGARNIPLAQLKESLSSLNIAKERPIILTCENGQRSPQILKPLLAAGYQKTYLLQSGLSGWRSAGMPVTKK